MGSSFQLVECQPYIKRPANLYKYISKLIKRIYFLRYGKCIYKLYKCISDVKGGKSGSKFSARGMRTISPTDRASHHHAYFNLSCVPAHKMPRKAALFRQTGFSSFAKLNFLFSPMKNFYAAIAESPRQSKVLEMRRPSGKLLCNFS